MMIDNRVLMLKDFVNRHNDNFLMAELADFFEVSERQMGRILKKWQDEKLLQYIPASGRGRQAKIVFTTDVEKLILQQTISKISELTVEELQQVLELPFTERSKHELFHAVNHLMLDQRDNYIVVKYEYLPSKIDPAMITTTEEAQINYQVFETLYKLTADGQVKRNLVSYDEWKDNELHLYLKKEVYFSNGDVLKARDIKLMLERLKDDSHYTRLYSAIVDIEVVGEFKLILKFEKHPKFFEYNLASRYSAVYKDIGEGSLIGTGPYFLSDIDSETIELKYNTFYRGAHPDVQTLMFTKDEKKYQDFLSEYTHYSFKVDFGTEFILFNPFKKTTKAQRVFFSDILLDSIAEIIDHPAIHRSTRHYKPGDVVVTKDYIKVLVVDFNKPVFDVFREKLKPFGIEVHFHETTNIDYINGHLLNTDVDMVWMFESYNEQQPFKTLDLLTHCKFQEWFSDYRDARKIVEDIDYRPHESLKSVCDNYLKKVEQMKYMIPIFNHKREVLIPDTMKNVREQPYGTIDYRRIVTDLLTHS